MIVITCLDDDNGMMFNKRRQSQDCIVRELILDEASGTRIWMNQYSYKQFLDSICENITVNDEFLVKARVGEYCFVESVPIADHEEKIEKIIIFRWNRKYPADFRFDISLNTPIWKLISRQDFKGHSHETITKEVYIK